LLACVGLMVFAAPAAAATYPTGGATFAADAEGWQATEADCSIPLAGVCSASGSHDPANGNPPGALTAETDVVLNLGGLFEASVTFESPDFVVSETGPAAFHLDRQFSTGGLLALAPQADYTVSLIDRGTETPTEVVAESLDEADSAFAGKDALTSATAGRTYAISIEVDTGSTATGLGVLGESAVRFDNIALTVQDDSSGAGTEGGGPGGSGPVTYVATSSPTADDLRTLVRRNSPPGARLVGQHVFVKVRCPRRVGGACRITAQGRIKKRTRVTRRRTVRVARGRSRTIALQILPRFRERLAGRKRLLIVQWVRVGGETTTFARSRALIRRG
ncbi:MAG TPA: hypothetical protein VFT10_05350, partial [Solirubrobacterales bacterium]|nr:hypothetical protein [Solirubrobacterales bacterium]